jgi:hypothetical protein
MPASLSYAVPEDLARRFTTQWSGCLPQDLAARLTAAEMAALADVLAACGAPEAAQQWRAAHTAGPAPTPTDPGRCADILSAEIQVEESRWHAAGDRLAVLGAALAACRVRQAHADATALLLDADYRDQDVAVAPRAWQDSGGAEQPLDDTFREALTRDIQHADHNLRDGWQRTATHIDGTDTHRLHLDDAIAAGQRALSPAESARRD